MTSQQLHTINSLIEQGKYEQALAEANFGYGYWPDERYESAKENVRQALETIILREKLRKQ